MSGRLLAAAALGCLSGRTLGQVFDPLAYVDPLIGANNGGNVFPGASLPYGMAKAVADTASDSNQGGFTLDGFNITGFSAMHDSGTGGSPSLGNFPLFAYTNCAGGDINRCDFSKKRRVQHGGFTNESVVAKPGLFSVLLRSGVQASMTTTQHAALFKFTFPPTGEDGQPAQPFVLQDMSDLSNSRQDNATVTVDATTGRIKGSGRFQASFGGGTTYTMYFCTDFSGPAMVDNGIYVDSRASADVKEVKVSRSINGFPLPAGGWVRFANADKPLMVRTASSFISTEQACARGEAEIPDFGFDNVVKAATDAWKQKLNPIVVDTTGVNTSFVKNFYSGIYRTMINPQNYTGENPLWQSSEPYFDSFYW
jgi:putative alpha-1,2-mannosidase